MKKSKKFIALLLSLIMTVMIFLPITAAATDTSNDALPIVYLYGRGSTICLPDGTQIFDINVPDGYIADKVKKALPVLAQAMISNNWDEYADFLCDSVEPLYEKLVLDGNGNATDGSNVNWSYNVKDMKDTKKNGVYGLKDYTFWYDWRLDPCEVADQLNGYIKAVKQVTGAEKVVLSGRCLGANMVMAYLYKYGCSDIDTCMLFAQTIKGCLKDSKPFAGKFAMNSDGVERFLQEGSLSVGDDVLDEFLRATVSLLNKTYGIQITGDILLKIVNNVRYTAIPRLLRNTYATFPSMWSMVEEEDYEDAKSLVFSGVEEEYAGLITKIDNYHYNIQQNVEELLQGFVDEGMHIAIICKYGLQGLPICEGSEVMADDTLELKLASFGATCANMDETLSDDYISAANAVGNGKYISPDKIVDASTCLFPDYTWYIENLAHIVFPESVDALMLAIARFDGQMTVNDNPLFPQYIHYDIDAETITPLTAENAVNKELGSSHGFLVTFIEFMKAVIKLISNLMSKVSNK